MVFKLVIHRFDSLHTPVKKKITGRFQENIWAWYTPATKSLGKDIENKYLSAPNMKQALFSRWM